MQKANAGNSTKNKRLSENKIKKQPIDSLIESERVETKELNEKVNKVDKSEEAASIIKEYEAINRTKKKNIICIAYHQGKLFRRFKEKEWFQHLR